MTTAPTGPLTDVELQIGRMTCASCAARVEKTGHTAALPEPPCAERTRTRAPTRPVRCARGWS